MAAAQKKSKILIFGAQGMLGQELQRLWSDVPCSAVDREAVDITDRELVTKFIRKERPTLVINAAAYNNVDGAETDKEEAMGINGYAVGYIAAAAEAVHATMVHYSTDYVFDGEKNDGYREDDMPSPMSIYGESKRLGETEALEKCSRAYVLRLSRLFGAPAKSQTAKQSFIEKMILLSKRRSTLTVVDDELSSPTYAPDLAHRTREIIDADQPYGIYHVTNQGCCTWFGFAKEIFTQRGWHGTLLPVPSSTFPRPARRPRYSMLLNTKLPPLRPWQEALKEYLAAAHSL